MAGMQPWIHTPHCLLAPLPLLVSEGSWNQTTSQFVIAANIKPCCQGANGDRYCFLVPVYNWYINVKMSLMWFPVQFKGPRSLDSLEMQYRSMYIALGLVFAMMQTIILDFVKTYHNFRVEQCGKAVPARPWPIMLKASCIMLCHQFLEM